MQVFCKVIKPLQHIIIKLY